MNLAFVCDEYPPAPCGGIGVAIELAATALSAAGHHVRVLVVGAAVPVGAAGAVEVVAVPPAGRPGAWWRTRRRVYRQLATWATNGELDAVEVPDYRGWSAFWGGLPVPVIGRLHGSHTVLAAAGAATRRRRQVWIEARAMKRWDFCSAVSIAVAAATAVALPRTVPAARVIPDPVPLPPAAGLPVTRVPGLVIHAGTLNDNKGLRHLLAAWPRVRERFPDSCLQVHVRGTAAARQELARQLTEMAQTGVNPAVAVHHWGHPEELKMALAEAVVAVFPSRFEAFGLAAAEAMACGCAVIAGTGGAGPELISDGEDGILVNVSDPAAVAEAICYLLDRPDRAAALGRQAAQRIRERCAPERVGAELADWYAECSERFRTER